MPVCRKDMETPVIADPVASYRHGCDPPGCEEDLLASPVCARKPRTVAVCGLGTPAPFHFISIQSNSPAYAGSHGCKAVEEGVRGAACTG